MRDFTYVDDVVEAVIRIMQKSPDACPGGPPNKNYKIGNNAPGKLSEVVEAIETVLGIKAEKKLLPLQPGDVPATYADVTEFVNDFGYKPSTSVKDGVKKFIDWYKKYYKID